MAVSVRGTVVGPARQRSLSFTFRPSSFIGRTRGQFNALQGRATAAHDRMAMDVQGQMRERLRTQIAKTGRPQRGSRELETALVAEGNRRYNMDGFSVGIESVMDSSPAGPYWRNLEQGSRIFVGRFVSAIFFDEAGRAHPASSDRRRQDVRMPQFSFQAPVAGRSGRSTPAHGSVQNSSAAVLSIGRERGFQIREPIPAYHYMSEGFRNWLASGRDRAIYREAFADLVAQGVLRL